MSQEKVGWVGLGVIGSPMAKRLIGRPGGFVVCDSDPAAVTPFVDAGVEVVADAGALVSSGATFISIVVRDDRQVRGVVEAMLAAGPAPGTVLAIHSTIEPATAEELAESSRSAGVTIVDAPVSGGPMGAANGTLAVLLGGAEEVVERCETAFAPFATKVVHFGSAGAGTRAKIARNLITFAGYAIVAEGQRLAESYGIDLIGLGDVVRHSDAATGGPGAVMLRDTTAPISPDDPLHRIFEHSVELGSKDLDLALAMAADAGLDLPLAGGARQALAAALGIDG